MRSGFRGTVIATGALALALAGCAGCGSQHARSPAKAATTATSSTSASTSPAKRKPVARAGVKGPNGGLQIGLTEANADLLYATSVPVAPSLNPARDSLDLLRPAYLRLDIDWAALQPTPGSLRLDASVSGCQRGARPCAPYAGVRDELRAIASQQRAGGGFTPVITIYAVPAWAARGPSGCEKPGTLATSRPITSSGLDAYRQLISSLIALGRSEGVTLRWWSPWDEPNHPYFISPQRSGCSVSSPAVSPGVYASLARAMAGALHAAGGDRHMLLGELADFPTPRRDGAGIGEFVADLPSDVVCAASAWAVHEYPRAGAPGATPGGVRALESALDARGACGRRAPIWVTETGAGEPHVGRQRPTSASSLRSQCQLMNRALLTWYHDPRVDVAFQYSFREDSLFPVGLATPGLDALYPTYYLMRAWGGSRAPSAPPPALPPQCA